MAEINEIETIHCPSAQPSAKAVVFGVVTGPPADRRIGYLTESQPLTASLRALAGPATPGQVFRMAAPCAGDRCRHFDDGACSLVRRVVALFDPVVSGVPPCRIRPTCRWFRQEGRDACLRCPQVVTDNCDPTELQQQVAGPEADGPDLG